MTISVVIPAYNAAHFLPRCLESVSAKTRQTTEVIVVDDGSKDDTAVVAEKLGATVVCRSSGGLSAARNTGIQGSTGEWIRLLDSDDRWSPEKLRAQVSKIQADTVLVYTGIRIFDDDVIRQSRPAVNMSRPLKVLRYKNPITRSVLARRDALLETGGFREDIRACEDWDMWVRLSRLGSFAAVTESLTDHYVYPNSMNNDLLRVPVATEQILSTTLAADLGGASRWTWRQRVRAVRPYSAALIARDNGLRGEIAYMLRSLGAWSSPMWEPQRFVGFLVSVRDRFCRSREIP